MTRLTETVVVAGSPLPVVGPPEPKVRGQDRFQVGVMSW